MAYRRIRSAFTLVELVMVIALMGIVAIMVVPTYQLVVAQVQLASSVSQLADIIRLQQQRTVSEQKVYGVTMTATDVVKSYTKCTNMACTTTASDSYTTTSTRVATFLCINIACTTREVDLIDLPLTVEIDQVTLGGQSEIKFTTAGSPSNNGTIVMYDPVRNRRRDVAIRPSGAILTNTSEY